MNKPAPLPLSAKRLDYFTPPSIKGKPNEICFGLRIATPSERDRIGTKLYEMGIRTVDESLVRATMIDELYNMDWGKGDANEVYAEELAGKLESFWVRAEAEQQAIAAWSEREIERMRDQEAEGVEKEAEPMPSGFIKPRERAEMHILCDRIAGESQRVRELMGKRLDFGKRNDQILCRIHVVGIDVPSDSAVSLPMLEYDPDGLLSEESLDDIRELIGSAAYRELVLRIDQQYNLSEEERKNSDSLLVKPSPLNGSTEPSGDSASSDGKSTE